MNATDYPYTVTIDGHWTVGCATAERAHDFARDYAKRHGSGRTRISYPKPAPPAPIGFPHPPIDPMIERKMRAKRELSERRYRLRCAGRAALNGDTENAEYHRRWATIHLQRAIRALHGE
jgi:hypothetical protein